MASPRTEYSATLLSRHILTSDVIELRFSRPSGFLFEAGQFVQFKIPQPESFVWRSYSFASPPSTEYLAFCLKIIPGGKASDFFLTLAVGTPLSFTGPHGFFLVTPTAQTNKVFIGTGTGLAPLLSILEDRVPQKIAGERYSLLYGVRTEQDVFYQDRLTKLVSHSGSITCNTTLSQPQNPDTWVGLVGRVTTHIPTYTEPTEYYICGSLEMIKDVRAILMAQKVPMKQIHFEIF